MKNKTKGIDKIRQVILIPQGRQSAEQSDKDQKRQAEDEDDHAAEGQHCVDSKLIS